MNSGFEANDKVLALSHHNVGGEESGTYNSLGNILNQYNFAVVTAITYIPPHFLNEKSLVSFQHPKRLSMNIEKY